MKWKEVLSSVRGQCVYIGWRLEDIKSVIYKLSKYCIKMRHIQQRNLSHFCKVFFLIEMGVSITAPVHFLCLYMDNFLPLNMVVDFFVLFIDCNTENLISSKIVVSSKVRYMQG